VPSQPPRARAASISFILVTVFLDVLGMGLIIPVLPPLVGEFVDGARAQATWYGLLVGGYGLAQFVAAPLLGALSDRFGRRPVLLLTLAGLGADFLLMALAGSLPVLMIARLIGGATAATVSVASAYVADVTTPEHRARGFGMIGAMFGIGFVVGPVAGGLLGDVDLRWPFYAAAALTGLNVLYGAFVLPESLPAERRTAFALGRANPLSALGEFLRTRGVGALAAVFTLATLAQFVLHATWVLYTGVRFGWGPRDAGLSLFAVGIAAVAMQGVLLGRLVRRYGERRVAIAGLVSGALSYPAYALVPQDWMVYPVIVGNLLGFAAVPAIQALISQAFDPSKQGNAMGALNAISGIATVVAPLAGTAIFAQVATLPPGDPRMGATFYLSCALQSLATLVALRAFARVPGGPGGASA